MRANTHARDILRKHIHPTARRRESNEPAILNCFYPIETKLVSLHSYVER